MIVLQSAVNEGTFEVLYNALMVTILLGCATTVVAKISAFPATS